MKRIIAVAALTISLSAIAADAPQQQQPTPEQQIRALVKENSQLKINLIDAMDANDALKAELSKLKPEVKPAPKPISQ
jgi:flagellar basal body-associated protein FliL